MSSISGLFGGGNYTIRDQFVADQANNGQIVGQAICDPIFPASSSVYATSGVFLSTGTLGMLIAASQTTCYTTTDMITMTSRSLGYSVSAVSACASSSMFMVISSTTQYKTSTDGINWTTRTLPLTLDQLHPFNRLIYSNGMFILFPYIPSTTSSYYTTTDGVNWTTQTFPISYTYCGLDASNGVIIVQAASVYYSTNGTSWTAVSWPIVSTLCSFSYNTTSGIYTITAGSSGTFVYSSGLNNAPRVLQYGTIIPTVIINDVIFFYKTWTEVSYSGAYNSYYRIYKGDSGGSLTEIAFIGGSDYATARYPVNTNYKVTKLNNIYVFHSGGAGSYIGWIDTTNLKEAVILK
jgi:hypothetical protein